MSVPASPNRRFLFIKTCISVSFIVVVIFLLSNVANAATIVVPVGGDLQAAINAAQYGDTIVLQAGVTYESSGASLDFAYALNYKGPGTNTDADYITIQSSAAASLPEGGRVSPANAPMMARVGYN